MTETRAARLKREHAEVARTLDGLTREITLVDSGRPPSPEILAAERVDLATYRRWSGDERSAFDHAHPQRALLLKEQWVRVVEKETR